MGFFYSSAVMQLMYSTAQADWAHEERTLYFPENLCQSLLLNLTSIFVHLNFSSFLLQLTPVNIL